MSRTPKLRTAGPWVYSPAFDIAFILSPAVGVAAIVLLFPELFERANDVPLWAWVVLVIGVDVAHVYSTLFRTYFDPEEFRARRALYLTVPFAAWAGGILLYLGGAALFWRALAYIAVYHFVRQQYGFMMIYARDERTALLPSLWLDRLAIYLATIYPLIFWHAHPREFSWFVEGDFVRLAQPVERIAFVVYLATLIVYLARETVRTLATRRLNWGKNLLLGGTVAAWYIGIVFTNGDLAFTFTNVIAHGIPYIALIWIYAYKKWRDRSAPSPAYRKLFQPRFVPFYLAAILILAYGEEAVWDIFVWHDHCSAFLDCLGLAGRAHDHVLLWLVPLLAVPQLTHYILDGFIWRIRKPDEGFKRLLENEG